MNRRISLVAAGVLVVLLLVWFVGVWRPAETAANHERAARAKASTLHTQLSANLAGLLALQRSLPSEEAKLRKAETSVPTSASVAGAIDQINSIAVTDHITWTNESQALTSASSSATASGATSQTTDSPLALTLTVAGSYPDMSEFITDLEHLPRLIVLDSLDFAPSGANVTVTISARAFYNATAVPSLATGSGGT